MDSTAQIMSTSDSGQHTMDDLRQQLARLSPRTLAILHDVLADLGDEGDE